MNKHPNPLLQSLQILQSLSYGDAPASWLAGDASISIPTLKRYLDDLRNMGAVIVSVKAGGQSRYHLANREEVMPRALRWMELEIGRSLV